MAKYTQEQEAKLSILTREYKRLTKAMERHPEDRKMYKEQRDKVVKQKAAIRNEN
ncbi:hypothetical protein V9L05_08790 [Bernardetia sp. Wsw4-3y2]|uniref:hypothetical protein n=1 Tax=Bernardetia sp. Wsw4-3y2 TaxID=3127471 RepID=UPI0030D49E6B